jgi:hypothetical protein
MKAKIKSITSPDVADLKGYKPDDPQNFSLLLQLFIGPSQDDGEEMFSIELCTPQWLIDHYQSDGCVWGIHRLIVFEYNYSRIIEKIQSYVAACEGENWSAIAQKLAIIAAWEFNSA